MNSGAFDEAAFDFLVSDEGGANVAADRARSAAKAAGAEPARDRIDASVNVQHRLDEVRAAANPLLEAATPLLRMLADMPATLDTSEAVASLRTLLVREVALFQNLCEKADLPWKHMAVVRYCLCTALDEAANRTRWGGGGVWASQSLLITYEGEVDGGEKFFLLIGRMATDPQEYVDILEILYRVLGLGFEGRYSVVADGRRHLEQIRQRLWTLITGARDAIQPELSLRWRGAEPGRLPLLRSVPAWASGALVFLLLFGLFAFYQYRLLTERNALEARILAIAKDEPAP
ncbi:type IVB secretion system protein IcmH/DotU, partial [Burkholderia pseudomallei]